MSVPELTRALVLERPVAAPDGAGGRVEGWEALGTLWAAMRARSGREARGFAAAVTRQPWTITVRAAPEGSSMRPAAGQRFREGGRVFRILAVAEADGRARFLDCRAEEEAAT